MVSFAVAVILHIALLIFLPDGKSTANEDAGYALLDIGAYGPAYRNPGVHHDNRLRLSIKADDVEADKQQRAPHDKNGSKTLTNWLGMQAPTDHR